MVSRRRLGAPDRTAVTIASARLAKRAGLLGGGAAAVLTAGALWGTAGAAASVDAAPTAGEAAALRSAIGAAGLLLAVVACRQTAVLRALVTGPARLRIVAAALAVTLFQVAFFSAVQRSGVALATTVALTAAPVVGGVAARIAGGRRPDARWTIATVLAGGGVVLLLLPGAGRAVDPLGIALAVVAGGAFAAYTIALQRRAAAGGTALAATAAAFTGAALLVWPFLLTSEASALTQPTGLALALWLGLATAAVPYALYARGLATVSAHRALTLTLVEPVTAVVLGLAVLGEQLGPAGVVGLLLVGAGLVIASLRTPRPRRRIGVAARRPRALLLLPHRTVRRSRPRTRKGPWPPRAELGPVERRG